MKGFRGSYDATARCRKHRIIHRRGHGSLDACVGSGGIQGDTTPTADAYDAYLLGIDIVLFRQEVDGCHKVLGIDVG